MDASQAPSPQRADAALQQWLAERLDGRGPFTIARIAGGNSNETYLLRDDRGPLVLRRPPQHAVDASAHDIFREHRLLSALEPTDAPSVAPIAICEDEEVLGVPFVLVEYVEGDSITDTLPAGSPPPGEAAGEIGFALVDALARLHAVDWRAAGLEGFGRPEGFRERLVPRWRKQLDRVRVRDLPRFDEVGDWLEANRPASYDLAVMHGDFHIDNCLIAFAGPAEVRAIIDWEMATIGDPLVDLGLMLGLWGGEEPAPPWLSGTQAVSRAAGSPSRAELAERYAARSGRDLGQLNWYTALALWKLAAVVEGAYANLVTHGDYRSYTRALKDDVPALVRQAASFMEREAGI
jgi:aminoglycoside phosphotransferase (APT) family kinase protein